MIYNNFYKCKNIIHVISKCVNSFPAYFLLVFEIDAFFKTDTCFFVLWSTLPQLNLSWWWVYDSLITTLYMTGKAYTDLFYKNEVLCFSSLLYGGLRSVCVCVYKTCTCGTLIPQYIKYFFSCIFIGIIGSICQHRLRKRVRFSVKMLQKIM